MLKNVEQSSLLVRVGVAFLVGVTVVAVALEYPRGLQEQSDEARHNSSLSFADREIAGGNGLVADQRAVYEARARIPESGTFRLDVADDYPGGSDLTVQHVDGFYRYFLMPRRPSPDAPWIICYACDVAKYGSHAEVVWRDDEGISIIRTRR